MAGILLMWSKYLISERQRGKNTAQAKPAGTASERRSMILVDGGGTQR